MLDTKIRRRRRSTTSCRRRRSRRHRRSNRHLRRRRRTTCLRCRQFLRFQPNPHFRSRTQLRRRPVCPRVRRCRHSCRWCRLSSRRRHHPDRSRSNNCCPTCSRHHHRRRRPCATLCSLRHSMHPRRCGCQTHHHLRLARECCSRRRCSLRRSTRPWRPRRWSWTLHLDHRRTRRAMQSLSHSGCR